MKPRPLLARITLTTLAFAAAAAGGVAPAADESPHPSQLFLQLDTNHDGYVSRSEAASVRGFDRAFAEADENRDGKLSADEFIKAESIRERQRAAEFAADSLVTAKVKAALIKDLQLKAFDVAVETNHGRVLLSGVVDDQRQAKRAAQLALAVGGVERVENALKPR
jgi:hyperosmotically inducible periplasmic protein